MLSLIRRASTFAVTCPGQGIVAKGCLNALKSHQHRFQQILDCVDETLGESFSSHLLEPPSSRPDTWSQLTSNAQPAIVASTYVIYNLYKELYGIDLAHDSRVSYLMGHSLGEYTALLLGEVITLPQAIAVVRKRGVLMEELVKDKDYAMAVLVFKPSEFDAVVKMAHEYDVLACINNSTQILISGEPSQLQRAVDAMNSPKKTILKQAKLPVTIPFHNTVLRPMDDQLAALVTEQRTSSKLLISNLTGTECADLPFSNTVKSNSRPVQWKKSMELLVEKGVRKVVNLGPGNAVDAINGRFNVDNFPLKGLEDFEALAKAMQQE